MGNSRYALVLALLVVSLLSVLPAQAATESYSDVTLYNWQKGHFPEVYDLTRGDIVVSYTIDMSSLGGPGWTVAEFGLRSVGAPDLDPTHEGGWLMSRYNSAANNDAVAELNDYHVLMKHGWLEEYYDATGPETIVTPLVPGAYLNYAFWFDRDGVDPYQATFWNYKDGVTYNTGGVYDIVITYHAVNDTTATMFATINGEQQGLYTTGYDSQNPPSLMPVGRTFTADMHHLQVFYGRGGGDGSVTLSEISVGGELYIPTIEEAIAYIDATVDHKGIATSLVAKLNTAEKLFLKDKEQAADNVLSAYLQHICAIYENKLDAATADQLTLWANEWIEDMTLAV